MAKKWMEKLQDFAGAVDATCNPFASGIRTPSPSVNFTFGNTHLLPFGYSTVLWGPEKCGKSLLANGMIGQLHRDDPEAYAIKFNTEMRENLQVTPALKAMFGIDDSRYQAYETNRPDEIFDRIENDIDKLCIDGFPLKMIVIDSVNNILGRREAGYSSVEKSSQGDCAATIGYGLKRVLETIRRHKIALVLISQARDEMDPGEVMRGNKLRMAAAHQLKHFCEYFLLVERNKTAAAQTDLSGKRLSDDTLAAGIGVSDSSKAGSEERTAHKIRCTMADSTCGVRGRVGQFTFSYRDGIINTHEEVFELGIARNIFTTENNKTWMFEDLKWTGGKPAVINALQQDPTLVARVIKELKRRDIAGIFTKEDEQRYEKMLESNG